MPRNVMEGEIIVTATKRASTVQDVPFSVNAQTQEDIRRANAKTLEDISRNVAGLTVQNLGPGQSQVSIRGVSAGQIVRDQPGVKEQVGVYLDESVDLDVAVHAGLRPVRPEPRRDACAVRKERCSAPDRSAARSATSPTSRSSSTTEGEVEGDVNVLAGGSIGYGLKGAVNVPLGSTAASAYRRLWHAFRRLYRFGWTTSRQECQRRQSLRRPTLGPVGADARAENHAALRLSGRRRRTASTARNSTTSTTTSSRRGTTSSRVVASNI